MLGRKHFRSSSLAGEEPAKKRVFMFPTYSSPTIPCWNTCSAVLKMPCSLDKHYACSSLMKRTFTGVPLLAEIALLMRRRCTMWVTSDQVFQVATSATLGGQVVEFAGKLFNKTDDRVRWIEGDPVRTPRPSAVPLSTPITPNECPTRQFGRRMPWLIAVALFTMRIWRIWRAAQSRLSSARQFSRKQGERHVRLGYFTERCVSRLSFRGWRKLSGAAEKKVS